MTTMVVLWITILSGPMDGMTYGIPFQRMEDCKSAKAEISNQLDYDHNLECEAMPVEVDEE